MEVNADEKLTGIMESVLMMGRVDLMLASFDSKGLIYMNYVPRGTTVNAKYIVETPGLVSEDL